MSADDDRSMRFGLIGLGRMGTALGAQAIEKGHRVVGFDRDQAALSRASQAGIEPAGSVGELVARLDSPRIVFLYLPHGNATEEVVGLLGRSLTTGDVVVDGGNSHWRDSRRRHEALGATGSGSSTWGRAGA